MPQRSPRDAKGRAARRVAALAVLACLPGASLLSGCGGDDLRSEPRALVISKDQARFEAGALAYAKYCALCHGGEAKGYAADHAPSLVSKTFLESASDDFITRGIREGRPGTAMAGYAKDRGGPLDEEQIASIVAFLRASHPLRLKLPATPVVGDPERGEAVYARSCKQCHGTRTERGNGVQLWNPNLLSAATDPFLRYAIVHGRPGTPMPSFRDALSAEDIDNVVATLRSFATPPTPVVKPPPEPPPLTQPVINPNGKNPEFTVRDNRFIPIDEVKRALEEKKRIVIIDARALPDWYAMHIPGSIAVPYYSFSRLDALPKDGTWITAYCACPHHASGAVVDELRRRGFPKTAILDEGILEWKKRGYPVESLPNPDDPGRPHP